MESILTELATLSDTGTTTTADYCTDRIESVIDCINELISAYGYSTYVQSFLSLRRRHLQMLLVWRRTVVRPCSVAVIGTGSTVEVNSTSEAVQRSISMWIRLSFCVLVDIHGTR